MTFGQRHSRQSKNTRLLLSVPVTWELAAQHDDNCTTYAFRDNYTDWAHQEAHCGTACILHSVLWSSVPHIHQKTAHHPGSLEDCSYLVTYCWHCKVVSFHKVHIADAAHKLLHVCHNQLNLVLKKTFCQANAVCIYNLQRKRCTHVRHGAL
eukprot:GHUV01024928.1.p1 GENE.GHUV01024928.1~~GHUV01024928.1.p1  ORF type:complete len:152 (-),score=19.24 GHUV01024928.1:623-1078(-)